MPLLFSYGTLQDPAVQLATFGRPLLGQPDGLPRYAASLVPIDDPAARASTGRTHHANVTFTGDDGDRVPGTALEVTEAELASADGYEAPYSYSRLAATLASGRQAWFYLHTP